MTRKISAFILCFILAFSVCIYAENTETETGTDTSVTEDAPPEMPHEEGRMGRGRMPGGMGSGMGNPPQRQNMQPPQMNSGDENMQPPQMPQNSENMQPPEDMGGENIPTSPSASGDERAQSQNEEFPPMQDGNMGGRGFRQNPDGEFPMSTENSDAAAESTQSGKLSLKEFIIEYQTPLFSVVLLALAFVFVIFYKRKRY